MSSVAGFVVQESSHADWVSRHETHEAAVAAIEEMIRDGLAKRGEFNIREIGDDRQTVGVYGALDSPGS